MAADICFSLPLYIKIVDFARIERSARPQRPSWSTSVALVLGLLDTRWIECGHRTSSPNSGAQDDGSGEVNQLKQRKAGV